jgi:hypothetical protein
MRVNAKKGLPKSDKAHNVQNRIWCELIQLHTINNEKPVKKFMGRKRKSAEEKGKKHHPVALLRLRDDLGGGEGDLCRCCKETLQMDAVQPTACLFAKSFTIQL